MAKQRDRIAMSDSEILALYDECKSLNVATLGADGMPHLTTLWYAPMGDRLVFETYGKSQKIVNLQRDPRIAVLCEAGTDYKELRGVSHRGRAEIVDSGPRLVELMTLCIRRNHTKLTPEQVKAQAEKMAEKRVAVIVHPEKTFSWDHRKM